MLSPNSILLNRYRVLRELGHGGMGTVYEALDQSVSCIVALKETSAGNNNEARLAFEREAALLANLRHSALPKVMHYFSEDGSDFLVMEFIPGYDLDELLELRGAPFPQAQVMRWADELLKILEYLHRQQPPILHRDIKPSNLKLTKQGEIFLLDFGLAKGAAGQMATLVTSHSVRGYTPVYASLEQIHGRGTDPRSDLYSLAATLYHLLTGAPPIDAPARFDLIEDEQPDPLPSIEELNPQVSSNVATVVHRAMSINRKHRPASASAMREALRNAVEEDEQGAAEEEYRRAEAKRQQRDAERRKTAEKAARQFEEAALLVKAEREQQREAEEAARQFEEAALLVKAERQRQHEAKEAARLAEAERDRQQEVERQRREEEQLRREAEEKEARRLAEKAVRIRAEEEAARAADLERKRQEAESRQLEAARRRAEELRRREAEEARRLEAERERREAEEKEARRLAEEAVRIRAEEEAARAADEERKRQEAESRQLEAARRRAEELRRREAEEAARRLEAERERREADEQEAHRLAENAGRIRVEEDAKRQRTDVPKTIPTAPQPTVRSQESPSTHGAASQPAIQIIKTPPPERFVGNNQTLAPVAEASAAGPLGQTHHPRSKRITMIAVGAVALMVVGVVIIWSMLGAKTPNSSGDEQPASSQEPAAQTNNSNPEAVRPVGSPTGESERGIQSNSMTTQTAGNANIARKPASSKPTRTPAAAKGAQDRGAAERQKRALDALKKPL